jgi:mono/diheme cytochrome c family protein
VFNCEEVARVRYKRRKFGIIKVLFLLLLVFAGVVGFVGWYKFFREEPQPDWVTATPDMRFKYGSIGAEHDAGMPYWIWYVLPRMFPDKLPGPGGYAALGVGWEQGQELPIGFTKKVIGFPRVANTCAACHTARYRSKPDETPTFVPTGPSHTLDLEAFFRFAIDAAKDPRFNADNVLREIKQATELSWLDQLLYRYLIIPITKKRLLEREQQFAWIYRKDFPEWGRGRDDAMNLTKYFMIRFPMDDTFGPTDMPSIWNLQKYKPEKGHLMNLAGDSHDARSVIIDSALGVLGAAPHRKQEFLDHIKWFEEYLGSKPAPKYPFPIDERKAAAGKGVFDKSCAACHASERTGTRIPLAEVGTDRGRLDTWSKEAAIAANKVVGDMGIERKGLVEEPLTGYIAAFLDGIWLRAPYLHNGSVPTLRDLLRAPDQRPPAFFRGYDVYDSVNVGFITSGSDAEQVGSRYDVRQRGNGNQGHDFGTDLASKEKDALIEYLKTL